MKVELDFKHKQVTIHVDKELLREVFTSESTYDSFINVCVMLKELVLKKI